MCSISISICSIDIKWDGKSLKRDEVKTNKSVKWRWFIVPTKVEQINDYLFIDTYKSNKINWLEWYDGEW